MRIRSPKDFWSGLIFIVIALGFILLSRPYGMGNMHRMGPALFPTIMGIVLAGLGLIIAGRAFALDGPPVPHIQARPILIGLAAIILFGTALQWLGLIAAVMTVVITSALASAESRVLSVIVLAAGLAAFSAAVFVFLLGLPIPLRPGG
jgi:Tripartite tricarboxylate transporter TctB family